MKKDTKIIAYTRVSKATQTTENQKHYLSEFAQNNRFIIDEFIEVTISSRKKKEFREINETIEKLNSGDTLLVYALDRLGRSTLETLSIIEEIKNKGIILKIVKENITIDKNISNSMNDMMMTMLSAFADLERSFISERVKAGLEARKAKGIKLGRIKGSIGKSKYDKYEEKIQELYSLGLSLSKIVDYIGEGTKVSLASYIKTRNISKEKSSHKIL
jgi:DNA invertase Pin-like site-specific DNA recombinase